jgi:FPC/CPF motif-containing protein YcgG
MSNLDITIPHQLPKEEALSRIKNLLANLQQEQKDTIKDVQEEWDGPEGKFSFNAKGFNISGNISVGDESVTVNGQLPFMLSFFKGKISEVIEEKARKILSS